MFPSQEAMLAELPSEWSEVTDPATGDVFYHNKETGATEWEHPTAAR